MKDLNHTICWEYLKWAIRALNRSIRVRLLNFRRYEGDAYHICKSVLKDCWNGKYFTAGTGHFARFWTRDFGLYVDDLVRNGYRKKVHQTLEHVLPIFARQKRITTTIFDHNRAHDVFSYSPDSLALLVHSIKAARAYHLVDEYRDFLRSEVRKFHHLVLDPERGIVRLDRPFTTLKDNVHRISSMYNNTMMAMLARDLWDVGLENPFRGYNFRQILHDTFWTGRYFRDDLSGDDYVSGDANTIPFWAGIFGDPQMKRLAVDSMHEAGLADPFPLRYTNFRMPQKENALVKFFLPNYQGDNPWTIIAPMFIRLTSQVYPERAREYIEQYRRIIERDRTLLELFHSDGNPFRTLVYFAEEGMLWASGFLDLLKSPQPASD